MRGSLECCACKGQGDKEEKVMIDAQMSSLTRFIRPALTLFGQDKG
jgi:hypothetical protein